jgi:predicted nucleic acid-binding protein
MVGVLLDTCVLSEIQRAQGSAAVRAQVEELDPEHLYLSVITLGELVKGIALLAPGARRRGLERWLLGLEQRYSEHLLGIDAEVSRLWGELTARAQRDGVIIPATDGLIAATARRHGLHVMTRNTKHFAATEVPVIDPWAAL